MVALSPFAVVNIVFLVLYIIAAVPTLAVIARSQYKMAFWWLLLFVLSRFVATVDGIYIGIQLAQNGQVNAQALLIYGCAINGIFFLLLIAAYEIMFYDLSHLLAPKEPNLPGYWSTAPHKLRLNFFATLAEVVATAAGAIFIVGEVYCFQTYAMERMILGAQLEKTAAALYFILALLLLPWINYCVKRHLTLGKALIGLPGILFFIRTAYGIATTIGFSRSVTNPTQSPALLGVLILFFEWWIVICYAIFGILDHSKHNIPFPKA